MQNNLILHQSSISLHQVLPNLTFRNAEEAEQARFQRDHFIKIVNAILA